MGSSCLIKTCTVKKARVGASFHRLPWKHPALHSTLQLVFGGANVRELTRWSRICSLHIAQLAPLAATHDAVRRLMEYYAWNARSYKRIFELSRRAEACDEDEKACQAEGVDVEVLNGGDVAVEGCQGVEEDGEGPAGRGDDTEGVEGTSGRGDKGCEGGDDVGVQGSGWHGEEGRQGGHDMADAGGRARVVDREGEQQEGKKEEQEEEEGKPGRVVGHLLLHILADALAAHHTHATPPTALHTPSTTTSSTHAPPRTVRPALPIAAHTTLSPVAHLSPNAPVLPCHSPPPPSEGRRSMIPDDCASGAMDAARDPDVGLEDAGKSKKTADDQDINDNHTKTTPPREDEDEDDNTSLTNGEVGEIPSGKESDINEEKADEGESEVKGEEEEQEEEVVGGAREGETQLEVSDEDKESSEDDEDKLVISEGNEKPPEDSADDSSKGETPAQAPSKPPSTGSAPESPRRSEKRPAEGEGEGEAGPDSPSKRPRPLEEMVCLDSLTSLPQVEGSLAQLKRDLEAMEFLIKQKEEEWNTLLRLQKRKEELYVRLARRRQTLLMRHGEGGEGGAGPEQGEEGNSNLLFLPQGGYSSLGGPQLPLMMMSQLLGSSASAQALQMVGPAVVRAREGSPSGDGSTTAATNNGGISVIDIHTSTNKPPGERSKVTLSHEAQSKLTRHLTSSGLTSMKPILPKPPGAGGGIAGLPSSLSFSATGHGPQGPTVNVQDLIAAHRKENPNTPPIRRATRGAWRSRYDGDKRPAPPHRDQERPPSVSSSSSDAESRTTATPSTLPPSSKSLLTLNDPSVSYKDVLLRFAELTQIEKQPGSPQISIFPVASTEGSAKRSDMSRESTPSMRSQTPPTHHPASATAAASAPASKSGLEAPSALAKLLLESRAGVSSSSLVKGVAGGGGAVGDTTPNSHYLTLSALLSGGSTTTMKDKLSHSQSEGRSKKTASSSSSSNQPGDEGSSNPKCQGCFKQRAQFVCAGCGNQWYCSRECQVSAWEEHSEHCSN